jgi:hypothetical protein
MRHGRWHDNILKEDEILKRMLKTPPKPNAPTAKEKPGSKRTKGKRTSRCNLKAFGTHFWLLLPSSEQWQLSLAAYQ